MCGLCLFFGKANSRAVRIARRNLLFRLVWMLHVSRRPVVPEIQLRFELMRIRILKAYVGKYDAS